MSAPFRGSEAVQAGEVSRNVLHGRRFVRVFPDVYVPAGSPLTLSIRSMAAHVLADGYGVLVGYSAAELLGAVCAPRDVDAEIGVPGRTLRDRPGLRVHRDHLADDEVTEVHGMLVTTPVRTAYDLARWQPTVEAVAAVDALARLGRFAPARLMEIRARYPNARWRRRVPKVVALADSGAESVMESRLRLVMVQHGLPRPVTQFRIHDIDDRLVARLDLAYPEHQVGVEYDGRDHDDPRQARRDAARDSAAAALGWVVLRFSSDDVLRQPHVVAQRIRHTLARRAALRTSQVPRRRPA